MKSKEEDILTLCYLIVVIFIGIGFGVVSFFFEFLPILGQLIAIAIGFFGWLAVTLLYLLAVQSRRKEK